MPDISMCTNFGCSLAKTCYRSEESGTQPSQYRQSYLSPKNDGANCEYYFPIFRKTDDAV